MRVTNSMLNNQVVFNMQRSLERFMTLQSEMSSGRRINNPSDDPVGTLRDLDYRTELSKLGQYQKNVSQAQNWLDSYDSSLADVKDSLNEAKDIALAMSNDTYNEEQRVAAATQIHSIFDRLMQLSGTSLGGRQMFSGDRTRVEPLQLSGNGVIYRGNNGQIRFEVEAQERATVNTTAAEVFLKSFRTLGEEADLNVALTDTTLLADLNVGEGIDLTAGTVTITDMNLNGATVTIDMAAAPPLTTVGEAVTRINDALTAAGMNGAVTIEISEAGNSLQIAATPNGRISTATRLDQLNLGQGIDLTHGSIKVTDGAGADILVDISSATTIDEVINQFNIAMAAEGLGAVTMSINATATGLSIDDAGLPPSDLTIGNAGDDDFTASQLGITGFVGSQLVGTDLQPQALISIADTTGTIGSALGLTGEFRHSTGGADLDPAITTDSLLSNLRGGLGFDGDGIVIQQGGRTLRLDLNEVTLVTVQDLLDRINNSPLDVTASLNEAGSGIQLVNDDPYTSLAILEDGDGLAAKQMGLFGSSDMMGSLIVLEQALKSNDLDGINLMLENFDQSMNLAVESRAAVGTKAMSLEATSGRLLDMRLSFTRLLADVEDADMTKVITDLATAETSYQAALSAAASIIQPSLLDFLR